jgi:hypothetical protein
MAKSKQIKFDLLTNAKDSLRQAVELLAWKDMGDHHARLKHAITSAVHAIELLLKEKLRRTNPAFIWENVDKYPSLEARTVTVDTAISRLKKIAGVSLSDADAEHIKSLRKTRNAIEHYEWSATESEARIIVGNALSFAFSFGKDELGVDLSDYFKQDDTWRMLIDDLYEFARAHGTRIETQLQQQGKHPVCCDSCGEVTVPLFGGSCELCGHWQDVNDVWR